ncbi:MAG: serine hydrolase domain-containing protein [Roseiarcus sp.]|jgi:CubicO group peptidase (beta-lactamase class C family)
MNAPSNALSGLPTARPEEVGLSSAGLRRMTDAMEREIAARHAPGMSMLIARHGKVAFAQSLGALRPDGPPMSADAIFRIYSMTKPIVTVAAMTLVEEGRLLISDPLAKYIPAFADMKVGVENGDKLDLVPAKRPITIQDLMRHTSGLTYGFTGLGAVQKLTHAAGIMSHDRSTAEHMEVLATLPLQHQPGEVWEYSLSTDVLGRVIEIVAGRSLGEFLRERIFAPLGMTDTGFYTPESKHARRALPFSFDLLNSAGADTTELSAPPRCEMGGGGLFSTISDYARFLAMVSGGGAFNGGRILGSRTLAFMASDHLGPHVVKNHPLLWPGHGFGLGFAVRLDAGIAPTAGAVGEYFWGGIAGTVFWISPRDALFAILMVQAPEYREYFRLLFRNLVNAAIV